MGRSDSTFGRIWLPAALWAILIFVGSSIPAEAFPSLKIFDYDKLIHLGIFFVFGMLVYRALGSARTGGGPRSAGTGPVFSWTRAVIAVLVVMAYGVLDEFHQSFVPGRTPDVWDATADTLGGILSAMSLYCYYRWRSVRAGRTGA